MASHWLKARQTKYAAFATAYILIFLAVVVVLNILANRFNKSFDATSNKRYSLSDQTAKIVRGLKQQATITYFNQSTRFREAKDLLDQYANLSPKVKVEYIDPDKNPQAAREAGIRSFGTAVVQIGAKKEEAKSMTEEGITGAFIRNLKSNVRTVCFVSGSGENQIDDDEGRRQLEEEPGPGDGQDIVIDVHEAAMVLALHHRQAFSARQPGQAAELPRHLAEIGRCRRFLWQRRRWHCRRPASRSRRSGRRRHGW